MSGYEARRDKAIRFRTASVTEGASAMTTFASNPVVRFLARRLLYSLVVLIGVLVVVFALVHLVPGDPVRIALGTRYTPEAYDALRSASGTGPAADRAVLQLPGLGAHRRSRGELPQRRPGDRHTARAAARHGVARRGRNRHRPAHRAARRHLVGAARGPRQRRDRPRHKPIRRLDPRLLDGHSADRAVRLNTAAGFRRRATGRCSTTPAAGCGTSSCPASPWVSWPRPS